MTDKLHEDTVSADRKERIIFDPEAWRKSDKSGRKTSAITSRQNFDNEKFTRKSNKGNAEQVDEGTIQPNDTSKVEGGGPEQSDTISKDQLKVKKSNNPQIEFVTGTANPNGSSSTAIGNAQNMGIKKISEALIEKAIKQVKGDSDVPFDGPYTKTPDTVVDKSGAKHTPYSRVRSLARQALKKQEQQNEACKDDKKKKKQISEEETVEEAVRITDPLRKKFDRDFGKKDGSFQGKMERLHLAAAAKDRRKVTDGSGVAGFNSKMVRPKSDQDTGRIRAVKEETEETLMSKTYTQFVEELDQLVEFIPEENLGEDYGWDHPEPKKPATSNVRKVQGTRYGGSKQADDNADEDWYSKTEKPEAPKAEAPVKRGRGRPAGSYGTYKARSAETKAAAAAKSAASKAANKAKQ